MPTNTLTKPNLARIKADAEREIELRKAATQGDWESHPSWTGRTQQITVNIPSEGIRLCLCCTADRASGEDKANFQFIAAAANSTLPADVLALIEEVERLERFIDHFVSHVAADPKMHEESMAAFRRGDTKTTEEFLAELRSRIPPAPTK